MNASRLAIGWIDTFGIGEGLDEQWMNGRLICPLGMTVDGKDGCLNGCVVEGQQVVVWTLDAWIEGLVDVEWIRWLRGWMNGWMDGHRVMDGCCVGRWLNGHQMRG